jgi:hypothetical protein
MLMCSCVCGWLYQHLCLHAVVCISVDMCGERGAWNLKTCTAFEGLAHTDATSFWLEDQVRARVRVRVCVYVCVCVCLSLCV